ncbi:MAG: hypothetical protein GC168_01060 [Candidatus Hydrogenedens sp.]|nr:hypothetical protein [Candidatus Hydrogenedens sp.]
MGMSSEHIELPERQAAFIRKLIAEGHFGDMQQVIRAGVSLLEERFAEEDGQKETLRQLMDEALSGPRSERSPKDIWEAAEARYLTRNA